MPKDSLRHRADSLARLLADERGAEILAELQKLGLETGRGAGQRTGPAGGTGPDTTGAGPAGGTGATQDRTAPAPPTGPARPQGDRRAAAGAQDPLAGREAVLGAWRVLPTPNGPELCRRALPPEELRSWAEVDRVPAADGATRVVLLGESSGRGFLLDPVLTPALALQRQLDAAGGAHQVVDLAHTGADLRDLSQTLRQLPPAEPDVIVVYAGNNWVRSRHTPGHLDLLAAALRDGDYASMRRAYTDRVVVPGVRRVLDCLDRVARTCRAEVVVVIPEFNLRDWTHDPELELPPLPAKDLLTWTDRRAEAETALAAEDDARVLALTEEMAGLDRGMSPVTGRLRAEAALRAGRHDVARAALVASRDAVCGLLATHTPRITEEVRAALVEGAARRGFRSVDLAAVLRADDGTRLPGSGYFLDYCHLSAAGIERTAAAVADVLAGHELGRTRPLDSLPAADRAVGEILAAVHNSYYRQPSERVAALVAGATEVPEGRAFAAALLRLLEGTGPVWASPAVPELTRFRHAARYLAPMMSRSAETLGMWSLAEALRDALGDAAAPAPDSPESGHATGDSRRGHATGDSRGGPVRSPSAAGPVTVDVLRTAEQGLVDGAFQTADHRPERAYLQSSGPVSLLGFRSPAAAAATVRLTYRVPAAIRAGDPVVVLLNGHPLGELPARPGWTSADLPVAAGVLRAGVNRMAVRWPCGGADFEDRRLADARRLASGDYPLVRGVQGELFDLTVETTS